MVFGIGMLFGAGIMYGVMRVLKGKKPETFNKFMGGGKSNIDMKLK